MAYRLGIDTDVQRACDVRGADAGHRQQMLGRARERGAGIGSGHIDLDAVAR